MHAICNRLCTSRLLAFEIGWEFGLDLWMVLWRQAYWVGILRLLVYNHHAHNEFNLLILRTSYPNKDCPSLTRIYDSSHFPYAVS